MNSVAVIYLLRKGNDPKWLRAFLASYARYPAGRPHDLVILLKGFDPADAAPGLALPSQIPPPVTWLRVSDDGAALTAFAKAAAQLPHERILVLNSFARILGPDWLAHFSNAFDTEPQCGIVGATASYEGIPGAPFPNPNIRTNAFMMEREKFLAIFGGQTRPRAEELQVEAGPNSLTRQIEATGLCAIIVDRHGRSWRKNAWIQARTFRVGDQDGLIVADNRTEHYQSALNRTRRKLARLAWGEAADVGRMSVLQRLRHSLAWRSGQPI